MDSTDISWFQPHSDHFRDVKSASRFGLRNLLPATESIGNDHRARRGLPHSRKKHALVCHDENIVVTGFESELTGHAAATESRTSKSTPIFRSMDVLPGASRAH
jgi:hypothetical protein